MAVLNFEPQFVPLVLAGTKKMTIRAKRKRPIKLGEKLSLRTWSGLPYRSTQKILRESHCIDLRTISLMPDGRLWVYKGTDPFDMYAYGECDTAPEVIARLDGFKSFAEFLDFFFSRHPKAPFYGTAIYWS